jgi:apolipoprotein N-acyltransferase
MDFTRWQAWATVKRWFSIFGDVGNRGETTQPAEYPKRHRSAVIGVVTSNPPRHKPSHPTWSESFIFAGSSSFLLLIANYVPDYWYVSFFALTPFLYRIIKATPSESLRLGFLFGFSFFTISVVDSLIITPLPSVLKLLSGTTLFALFAWTLGEARHRWGFNPFILVFLWVGLEMGLVKLGFFSGLLGRAEFSQPFLHGLVVLFGFLAVSAIIVLLNYLLVLAIVKTLRFTRSTARIVQKDEKMLQFLYTHGLFAQGVYLIPEGRAPPC